MRQAQLPLLDASADERTVLYIIDRTYASRSLPIGELFSCWRPGGPRSPWRNRKIWTVLAVLEDRGLVSRSDDICGSILRTNYFERMQVVA